MMLSDVCLTDIMTSAVCRSVPYIGPKSRTERPRKTKIGTEVAHVTRDSDTIFKVKRSKGKGHRGGGILWRPPAQLVLNVLISTVLRKSELHRKWESDPALASLVGVSTQRIAKRKVNMHILGWFCNTY